MIKERIPPKKFHLNRYQYHDVDSWIPPRTRDESLAAERRRFPHTLTLSHESRSAKSLARFATAQFDSASDQQYAQTLVARATFGSAYYNLQRDTMYSIVDLAPIAEGDKNKGTEWYQTDEELEEYYQRNLGWAAGMSELHLESKRTDNHELSERRRFHTGQLLARASLSAIVLGMPSRVRGQHPFDIKTSVREQTMQFVQEVGEYGHDIGVLPSLAQLVEPDSPLAVDIRRNAPTPVLRAYESAIAEFPEQISA